MTHRPTRRRTRFARPVRHLVGVSLLAGVVGTTSAADIAAGTVPTPTPGATASRSLAQVVAGIMGYTRWPGDSPGVRLCTVGRGDGVDELLRSADLKAGPRIVTVRAASGVHDTWLRCDALYLGETDAETTRSLLQALVGRPVLVLGEGATFCSDGGMFCLEPRTSSVRFQANLDAIARSGLRVNPMVLRIARAQGGGS